MTTIRKTASTSIVSSTTITEITMLERNLNIPYGLIHKVICIGYATLFEFTLSSELAHTLTPTVSANINGYSNTIDFDDSTYNYTAAAQVAASEDIITYDLGEVKDIIIYIKTGVWEYNANSIDLMVSSDGTTWTTIAQNISPANAVNAYQWKTQIIRTTARYVKLYYNDSSATTNNYAVATFEIYQVSLAAQSVIIDETTSTGTLEVITHNENIQIVADVKGTTEYSIIEINPTNATETNIEEV